ncbi:MAG: mevalonate kinase [Gammaproteobacteria bacterium]|nr:mevalonate kinase [Gammaproteobacteria bacterium]
MSCDFQTTTHGKWILAGEHAVLRGHGALVFPLLDKKLTLQHSNSDAAAFRMDIQMIGRDPNDMNALLKQLLDYGLPLLGQTYANLKGHLLIQSTIPVGVGMGASAALCVALARWFVAQQWLSEPDEYRLARELENTFHGQSSGLDIAGVSTAAGVYFQNGSTASLTPTWSPKWQLTSCGQQGPTADCISKVQTIWGSTPDEAQQLDLQMQASVVAAKQALEQPYSPQSNQQLIQAMHQANDCFERWGLLTPNLHDHMQSLRQQGALAVKPTGSGGGGYVVSLWHEDVDTLALSAQTSEEITL